jgi:hypothetical protein
MVGSRYWLSSSILIYCVAMILMVVALMDSSRMGFRLCLGFAYLAPLGESG